MSDTPEALFSKVVDRESLYEVGSTILGLDDAVLTESQKDFKRCYDLWLGLGNGFYDVYKGTYLASLPRAVSVFDRIGSQKIAVAGNLVLAEFSCRNFPTSEEEIDHIVFENDTEIKHFEYAIKKIDEVHIGEIWADASIIEQQLIALAKGHQIH